MAIKKYNAIADNIDPKKPWKRPSTINGKRTNDLVAPINWKDSIKLFLEKIVSLIVFEITKIEIANDKIKHSMAIWENLS